jgi:hypothetical protein
MDALIKALFLVLLIGSSTSIAAPTGVDSAPRAAQARIALIARKVDYSLRHSEPLRRDVLADTIEIRHVPAMAGDPEIVGKQHFGGDLSALKKAMKDFRMVIASTILEADAFTVKLTLVGTRVSGAKYSSVMSLRFIVGNGLITGLEAAQDPAERAMLGEIAAEGGFGRPPSD